MTDKRRTPQNEFSDSEDEGDDRRDRQNYKERSSLMSHDRGEGLSAGVGPMDVDVSEEDNEADDEGM